MVRLIRYIVVHDSGRIINPMIVDGQVLGAVAHGIGATLYEWMRFDEQGQPQTVTYGDYLLPSTDTVPPIEVDPHGIADAAQSARRQGRGRERHHRGAGGRSCRRSRTRCKPFGVRIRDLPLTPERLLALIRAARLSARGNGPMPVLILHGGRDCRFIHSFAL